MELGREGEILVGGQRYRHSRLSVGVIEGFRDWIKDQMGDLYAHAERFANLLPKEEVVALVREAREIDLDLKQFSLQNATAQRFQRTELGQAKLWQLLLLEHNPTITHDDALGILLEVGQREMARHLSDAQGKAPNGASPAVSSIRPGDPSHSLPALDG